jgi:hypothetical protein
MVVFYFFLCVRVGEGGGGVRGGCGTVGGVKENELDDC